MKKKRICLLAVTLMFSTLLSGCGTPMYELTESEEEIIAQYAAYVVAKHNISQKDGMVSVNWDEEEESEELSDVQPEDTEIAEETESSQTEQTTGENTSQNQETNQATIAEVLGMEQQVAVAYQGFYLTDNYQEGKYYSIDAHSGKKLLVMEFTLSNQTEEALSLNLAQSGAKYKANFDGNTWITQETTLLLCDLSTYQDTVDAGETANVVLLYEIPSAMEELITDISLKMTRDGTEYTINL